jgi:hypothetical protein
MLKLIVHHSPILIQFLLSLKLNLSKPQFEHMVRMCDALITTELRHKTVAGLYRMIVDAPDPSNGCDYLRISPWQVDDTHEAVRQFTVAEIVAYAKESNDWTLYVSVDDSLGEKDKATHALEAVDIHHDHTKSQGKKQVYTNGCSHVEVRLQVGGMAYVFDWRLYLREKRVRRLNRKRQGEKRLRFRKKTSLAHEILRELAQLLPEGFQVYVLFDSWYASNQLIKFCRGNGWHVICAIKSNRKLGEEKLSQWNRTLKHQRYQRVFVTATDQRQSSYLVRTVRGRLNKLSFDVCVLISKRRHRDTRPKYFLCTDPSLSAQKVLNIYQKRWPIEVDNFYVKQHLGLIDFRVQSFEATEKWFATVFLAYIFLQWRLNHAPPDDQFRSIADVIRHHRQEHARTLLEVACQEAVRLADHVPLLQRFICSYA